MTIAFAVEEFAPFLTEAQALFQAHFREIAPYQDLLTINPDVAAYLAMEKAGRLVVVTARDDGVLVGYFVMFVHKHLHYSDTIIANEDGKFIHAAHRGGTGMKLIKYAEQIARSRGAKLMVQRSKAKSEHGALYERMGYSLLDEVYIKRLDEE
jgi:GNAT superfamily N-acetyltransferase